MTNPTYLALEAAVRCAYSERIRYVLFLTTLKEDLAGTKFDLKSLQQEVDKRLSDLESEPLPV